MKKLIFAILFLGFTTASAKEAFTITSSDLPPGKPFSGDLIGHDFGCSGPGQSPALKWNGEPKGTKSFAITMFDTYRPPASGWWHWIVYNIPATTHELPKNAGTVDSQSLPKGAMQGLPDDEVPEHRYYGPCPDVGDKPHHYVITVYALSVDRVELKPTASGAFVEYTLLQKTLGKASMDRTYAR